MKRILLVGLFGLLAVPAWAMPPNSAIVVATCGTISPLFLAGRDAPLTVDVNGVNCTDAVLSGTVTANTTGHATAAAPSYIEGSDDALSITLGGNLRTTGVGGSFPVTAASGSVASGAIASGAFASGSIGSGAVASGAIASGAVASGAVASGAYASGSISDGADVTLGTKADAKSTATDTTQVTLISIAKEISFMEQTPASRAVTNAGTFAVQSAPTATTTGGSTGYVLEPGASDNHAVIKNGAGTVYDIVMFNNSATINYWRLYDAGTGFNGCNSATNLVAEGHIPASTSDAGFTVSWGAVGHAFTTGISICVTGAYGQTNTTNATASAISITIGYK